MKYETKWCEGYYEDEPNIIFSVNIALNSWDEVEDYEDEGITYYMDNEPLYVGAVVAENFIITEIEEKQNA